MPQYLKSIQEIRAILPNNSQLGRTIRSYIPFFIFANLKTRDVVVFSSDVSILSNLQMYSMTLQYPKVRLLLQKVNNYILHRILCMAY